MSSLSLEVFLFLFVSPPNTVSVSEMTGENTRNLYQNSDLAQRDGMVYRQCREQVERRSRGGSKYVRDETAEKMRRVKRTKNKEKHCLGKQAGCSEREGRNSSSKETLSRARKAKDIHISLL